MKQINNYTPMLYAADYDIDIPSVAPFTNMV